MGFPQFEVLNETVEMDIARTITSQANGIHLTVTDSATSGTSTGIRTSFTASGTRTAGTATCVTSDLTITGQQQYAKPYSAYVCQSGNPAIDFVAGYTLYMDDMGTGVSGQIGVDIGFAQSSTIAAQTRYAYIRCRDHGSELPEAVLLLEGDNAAEYLFKCSLIQDHGILGTNGAGGSTLDFTNWILIKVLINDVAHYIPCARTIATTGG